jgi:hypothetical protein
VVLLGFHDLTAIAVLIQTGSSITPKTSIMESFGGFLVELIAESSNGGFCTKQCQIIVPLETKDEKQCVYHEDEMSILEK